MYWYVTLFHAGHLGYQIKLPLAILNFHIAPMLSTKFLLRLTVLEQITKIFKTAAVVDILDIATEQF